MTYLAAEPDTAEAVIGDILTTFMAWAAEQELQAVSRRTQGWPGGGPGPRGRPWDLHESLTTTRSRPWPDSGGKGTASRSIGRLFGVSRTTVQRRLQEAVHLEDAPTS